MINADKSTIFWWGVHHDHSGGVRSADSHGGSVAAVMSDGTVIGRRRDMLFIKRQPMLKYFPGSSGLWLRDWICAVFMPNAWAFTCDSVGRKQLLLL